MKEFVLNNGTTVNAFWFGFYYFVFHQVLKNNPGSNAGF